MIKPFAMLMPSVTGIFLVLLMYETISYILYKWNPPGELSGRSSSMFRSLYIPRLYGGDGSMPAGSGERGVAYCVGGGEIASEGGRWGSPGADRSSSDSSRVYCD